MTATVYVDLASSLPTGFFPLIFALASSTFPFHDCDSSFVQVLNHLPARGRGAISAVEPQHTRMDDKGTSVDISVTTKMIHIDFHKASSEVLWGETLKSHNSRWDTRRGMRNWPASKNGDIAALILSKGFCRRSPLLLPAPNTTSEKQHATTQKSYLFN